MLRRLAAVVALSTVMLAFSVGSGSAAPMTHQDYPATELGSFVCTNHTYTFVSGVFALDAKSTDLSAVPAAHFTAKNVVAVDETGAAYRAVGTETYSDPKGLLVSKISFIIQGAGRTDGINVVAHYSQNGSSHELNFGTCEF